MRKKRFEIKDVGPSTAETHEIHYRMILEILEYRGWKTLKECVDEANDPKRYKKLRIYQGED